MREKILLCCYRTEESGTIGAHSSGYSKWAEGDSKWRPMIKEVSRVKARKGRGLVIMGGVRAINKKT